MSDAIESEVTQAVSICYTDYIHIIHGHKGIQLDSAGKNFQLPVCYAVPPKVPFSPPPLSEVWALFLTSTWSSGVVSGRLGLRQQHHVAVAAGC